MDILTNVKSHVMVIDIHSICISHITWGIDELYSYVLILTSQVRVVIFCSQSGFPQHFLDLYITYPLLEVEVLSI